MENKYYTPSIRELLSFIVNEGYCYGKTLKEEDNPCLVIVDNLVEFYLVNDYTEGKYIINPDNYLLKYLDEEDIKNLGFSIEWIEYNEKSFVLDNILLQLRSDNHVEIFDNDIKSKFESVMFRGVIKNKSELKRILEQVSVI